MTPDVSGYYFVRPLNPDSILDGNDFEIVYLYFNGRWSVIRPGIFQGESVDNFTDWRGPLSPPVKMVCENAQ